LYSSPNIIITIESSKRWDEHAALLKMKNAYTGLDGKPKGTDHSEDLGEDGMIILK
jgi:hypothetical protein